MSDTSNCCPSPTAVKTSQNDSTSTTFSKSDVNVDVKNPQVDDHVGIASLNKRLDRLHIPRENESKDLAEKIGDANRQNDANARSVHTDDSTCGYVSSTKLKSPDTKSMVSTTTCTMDEKESLRPDDSASVKATEDDDNMSTTLSTNTPRSGESFSVQQTSAVNGGPFSTHGYPLDPDEKLIDAMNSPKDRLLILQLEKRIIDFIRSSNEQSLELPPSNAFGRLLAHKLGDYYHLTHFVDVTSVRLHRTPYCRLPTPLSVLVANNSKTPPLSVPPMKIMRRAPLANSAPGSGAASSAPSKATSEAEGDDAGSSSGALSAKDRAALSREEREAKYQAARERIFRDFPESRSPSLNDRANDSSQSNSGNGRRKEAKQKTPHDDSFDARSEYNVYYPGIHFPSGQQPFNGAMPGVPFASPPQFAPAPPPMNHPIAYPVGPQNTPAYQGFGGVNTMPQGHLNYSTLPSQQPWQSRAPLQPPAHLMMTPPHNQGRSFNQHVSAVRSSPAMPYALPNSNAFMRPQPFLPPSQGPPGYQQIPPQPQRHMPPANWPQGYPQAAFPNQFGYDQPTSNPSFSPNMHSGTYGKPSIPIGASRPAPFSPYTHSFVPGGQNGPLGYAGNGAGHPDFYNQSHPAHMWQDHDKHDDNKQLSFNMYNVPPKSDKGSIAKWGTPSHLPPKPPPSSALSSGFSTQGRSGQHPQSGNVHQQQQLQQQQPPFAYSSSTVQKHGPVLVVGSNGAQKPRDP